MMAQWRLDVKRSFHSIGFKLFVIFFISIVAFVLAVGLISFNLSKRTIASEVSHSSLQTIVQANEKLDYMFLGFENLSNQIRNNTEFTDQVFTLLNFDMEQVQRVTTDRKVRSYLQHLKLSQAYVKGIYVLNDKGSFGTTDDKLPVDLAEQDWYKKTLERNGKIVWLPPRERGYLGIGREGESAFALSQVLKNSFNDPIGVLLIELEPQLLDATLRQIKLDSGNVLIRDEAGLMVANADPSWEDTGTFGVDGPSGQLTLKAGGTDMLAVYANSAVTGWTLIGLIPKAAVHAHADAIFRITLICAASATILALAIGYFLARMIGSPLQCIRNLMKEGAKGNLTIRSDLRRRDEIGQLGESFNQMMEQITELIQDTNRLAAAVMSTSSQIAEASNRTAYSAKEIAAATENIATGAVALADEAVEGNGITLTSNHQLQSVMKSNSELSDSALEVIKFSKQGILYMADLTANTRKVEHTTGLMAEKVERLKENTKSLEKIFEMLELVNQKTNILSLNAGIEASRAGAAGKGFMVLAKEMKNLSEQSRQSIDVVTGIIESIQDEIQATAAAILESQPIFTAQVNYVQEANEIFRNVHDFMEVAVAKLDVSTALILELESSQQALGKTIGNVAAVSQQSSALLEEVASQCEEQLQIGEGLVQLSEDLKQWSGALRVSLEKFQY